MKQIVLTEIGCHTSRTSVVCIAYLLVTLLFSFYAHRL